MTDPVSKYLPELADMEVYVREQDGEIVTEPAGPITIQQLATHTSGLTYGFIPTPVGKMYTEKGVVATGTPLPIEGGRRDRGSARLAQGVERAAGNRAAGSPSRGTEWHYSVGHGCARAPRGGRVRDVLRGVPARTPFRPARDARHGLLRPRLQGRALRGELRPRRRRRHDADPTIPRPAPTASLPRWRWAERASSAPSGTTSSSRRCS